ncbi:MAG: adenine phosphoribosyltransferase [Candidatus Helarchaeota archaeon]|nr:adenine phosphoribosyltransferase [Candidatus Helarchaeota archaeon]
MNLLEKIRNVPDWPKKGIQFKDITTLIQDPEALKEATNIMAEPYKTMNIQKVVSMEARGFIFGSMVAYLIGAGFIPIRKKGKLPYKTVEHEYEKEYGPDIITMHVDAFEPGERVLILDDLLATGGTALAAAKLVEKLKGEIVEQCFLIELTGSLHGRKVLEDAGYKVRSFIEIPVEE